MKKGLLFGLAYGLFILLAVGIGLYYSIFDVPSNKIVSDVRQTEATQSFEEALKADKERVEKKTEAQKDNRWKPSPTFVLVAISIGAIADIVIVILWARHENKKRKFEGNETQLRKKRITDYAIFWWIIGLGIVQKKNEKLVIYWRYMVAYIVLGFLLKVWITKELM
ncbi:hypothetical protein DZB84_05945 [Bacillus sp. HNG]|uniref:hypothetical protein n=1 Tax=Bacillus sp. HNG TaxID=2293325 RepID=UPI000E2E70C7|nr:hypothetical protein [Bacillus sp. HNG]RFB18450.1 hypothetical protein DZB84_05945 [Bacillus sp. HNG]